METFLLLLLYLLSFCVLPYFLYQVAIYFLKWKQHQERTLVQHANDLSVGVLLSVAVFYGTNLQYYYNWIALVSFLPTFFLYGFVSEQDFAHHSFVTVRHWSWKMWATVGGVAALVLALLGYHLYLAHTMNTLGYYFIRLGMIPVFLGGSYLIKLVNNKYSISVSNVTYLHFHHYQLFFFICFLPIFDDTISNISMGLAMAPFIQGISSYGPDSVFSS